MGNLIPLNSQHVRFHGGFHVRIERGDYRIAGDVVLGWNRGLATNKGANLVAYDQRS